MATWMFFFNNTEVSPDPHSMLFDEFYGILTCENICQFAKGRKEWGQHSWMAT